MGILRSLRTRLTAAFATRPGRDAWRAMGCELAWLAPLILLCGWLGGFVRVGPLADPGELATLAVVAIVAPALGEETLFRVLPIPRADEGRSAALPIAVSIAAFVAWHPLQAAIFGAEKVPVFLDPWFLLAVAGMGLALARLYRATGSIWPCVALHWLVVVGWKAFLGGPPNPFA